jgi:hypothetical protein
MYSSFAESSKHLLDSTLVRALNLCLKLLVACVFQSGEALLKLETIELNISS